MDTFVYRRDLLSVEQFKSLSQKSDFAGLKRLVIHLLLIAITGTIVVLSLGSWWVWPAYILHGTVTVFLFCPLHETVHATAFRSRKLNSIVGAVTGFLLFLPAQYFKFFHFAHHRYTGDKQLDPEMTVSKPTTVRGYYWMMTGISSYWIPQFKLLFGHAAGRVNLHFIPSTKQRSIIVEARIHLIGYSVLAVGSITQESAILIHIWILPLLFGMIFLRGFLFAEHSGCETSDNMLQNTRTTISNPFVRLLTWHMPYHVEHHAFPSVPFYNLPNLHRFLQKYQPNTSSGYLRVHQELIQSVR